MSLIVLTTFPAHQSQNVGDALITHSAVKLLRKRRPELAPVIVFRKRPLDDLGKHKRHDVLAPGFSVADGTYPDLFALFTDLDRMRHFWPVGCSFQHGTAGPAAFDSPYSHDTLEFLRRVARQWGPFPCRDELIVRRLSAYGLPAYYMGDLALFDEDKLRTEPRLPRAPSSLVITLGHHRHYREQTVDLAKQLNHRYPTLKKFVSLHSVANPYSLSVERELTALGYQSLHVHGEASGLHAYEDIDLHIGYRLHGHIHFLRNRKPSILMVEDARAYGYSRSPGTALGCLDAWDEANAQPDALAPERALAFLAAQQRVSFEPYKTVFDFIDKTFDECVAPYFDQVAAQLA